jgi:predicted nucleic acid-binding protein
LKVDTLVAQAKVEAFARGRVVRFTERDVIAAIELHRLSQISFWDAIIVRAARLVNASVLFSEDLASRAAETDRSRLHLPWLRACDIPWRA